MGGVRSGEQSDAATLERNKVYCDVVTMRMRVRWSGVDQRRGSEDDGSSKEAIHGATIVPP